MMFELNSISGKLDHLTMTQEHTLRYAQRRLEGAKLLEAQGEIALAQADFEHLINQSIPTVARDAEIALNRLQVRRMLSDLNQVSLKELNRLNAAISGTPGLSPMWVNSLQFAIAVKKDAVAKAITLGEALIKDPGVDEAIVFQYARLLWENKRPDEARTVLKGFVKHHPASSDAWASLGHLQQQQKEYSNAIVSYEKALKLDPKPRDLLSTARLYMRQGKWDKANTLIDVNQFQSPLQNEAYKLKAACFFQLKFYEKSAALYQKAYALTPDPNTLLSRVIALQVAGKYERALKAIQGIIEHERALPHIHFHRAQILIGTGMTAQAAESFVDFLKLAKNAPEHAKRVQHASKWMTLYQRSLVVPPRRQSDGVEPEQESPNPSP